jgi:hypothetical protein
MGCSLDEERESFAFEHFGIVTVGALEWRCVPVVFNRGGQAEIVGHGVDGFLWSTPEEFAHYTRVLVEGTGLRHRIAESAQIRAHAFSMINSYIMS